MRVTQAGVAEVTNQLLFDDEVGHTGVRALHELARDEDERPWMLVVSFTHPHDPYVTRRQYWDAYEGVDIPMPRLSAGDVPLDPHTARLRQVSAMDQVRDHRPRRPPGPPRLLRQHLLPRRVDRTPDLDTLTGLGVADDTVVVLLADHGDMLGERGLWYKMNFFEDSARVPLIVHTPTRFAPWRVAGTCVPGRRAPDADGAVR